ncbi:hypothetical protein AVEN_197693-1 [Araneus ventricosus]|uniref:Uncharacterized protein n=1 Tax=Araneus ventricosus TaxID=182803 RepID=A0A4Y2CMH5_ARAVE|nr:hypothetical protein AVEN_197693-1 [Araneus ventricosus]
MSVQYLYDIDGEEFYEEKRGRSANQGLQQPNSSYLLENQENSDIEIDDSDTDPDYVTIEDFFKPTPVRPTRKGVRPLADRSGTSNKNIQNAQKEESPECIQMSKTQAQA